MIESPLKIVCYGEILWDLFPDGKMLGGAPLNVARRLQSLGDEVQMISRLGRDALAEETIAQLHAHGLPQSLIQQDPDLETGSVAVQLNETGSAVYTIKKPVAWDAIGSSAANLKAVKEADLFIFGSLAARCDTSKNTLFKLLREAVKPVFDVNLRVPHYALRKVITLMQEAYLIKMNDEELLEICQFLGLDHKGLDQKLRALSNTLKARYICVTRGPHGALLLADGEFYTHPGYIASVVDTVGAGDSFLAGLLHVLFRESDPQKALAYGCALGALIASQKGANGKIAQEQISQLMNRE